MSIQEKILELDQQLVDGNMNLLKICITLPPADQLEFLPKIEKLIESQIKPKDNGH